MWPAKGPIGLCTRWRTGSPSILLARKPSSQSGKPPAIRSVERCSIDEPLHVPRVLVVSSRNVLANVPADLVENAVRPRNEHVVERVLLELELIAIEDGAPVEV